MTMARDGVPHTSVGLAAWAVVAMIGWMACGGVQDTDESPRVDVEASLAEAWTRVSTAEEAEAWRLQVTTARLRAGRHDGRVERLDALEHTVERHTCAVDRVRRALGDAPLPPGWLSPAGAQRCAVGEAGPEPPEGYRRESARVERLEDALARASAAREVDYLDRAWMDLWAPGCVRQAEGPANGCRDEAYAGWLSFLDEVTRSLHRGTRLEQAYLADLLQGLLQDAGGRCLLSSDPSTWTEGDLRLRLPWSAAPAGHATEDPAWPRYTLIVRSDALFLLRSPRTCWHEASVRFVTESEPLDAPLARMERPGALGVADLEDGRVPALRAAWRELRDEAEDSEAWSTVAVVADAETLVATLQAILLTLHEEGVRRALWWVSDREAGGRMLGLRLFSRSEDATVRISVRHDGYVIRTSAQGEAEGELAVVLRSAGTRLESISQAVWNAVADQTERLALVLDDPSVDIGLLAPIVDALVLPRTPSAAEDLEWLRGPLETDTGVYSPGETSVWLLLQAP